MTDFARRAQQTPDPETPPPDPKRNPDPDDVPPPVHAPIKEPSEPTVPIKAG
jgi:hypothetical protein